MNGLVGLCREALAWILLLMRRTLKRNCLSRIFDDITIKCVGEETCWMGSNITYSRALSG